MTLELILGLVRHALTAGGGVLVSKGLAEADSIEKAVGALIFLAGFGWSALRKIKRGTPPAK